MRRIWNRRIGRFNRYYTPSPWVYQRTCHNLNGSDLLVVSKRGRLSCVPDPATHAGSSVILMMTDRLKGGASVILFFTQQGISWMEGAFSHGLSRPRT